MTSGACECRWPLLVPVSSLAVQDWRCSVAGVRSMPLGMTGCEGARSPEATITTGNVPGSRISYGIRSVWGVSSRDGRSPRPWWIT